MPTPERAPDPDGTPRWDIRWDAEQRREAVALAKADLHRKVEALERAATNVELAADWVSSTAQFKAYADAKEASEDA